MSGIAPPIEAGHWFWGNLTAFKASAHTYPAEVARRHGGLAQFRILHKKFVSVNDADIYHQVMVKNASHYKRSFHFENQQFLIGRGLITTDGEEWEPKRQRANPAFSREKLRQMIAQSGELTATRLQIWQERYHQNKPIRISAVSEMQALTISIICKSLFSVEIDHEKSVEFCQALREANSLIQQQNTSWLSLPLWFPTSKNRKIHQTRQAMDIFVEDKIKQKKAQNSFAGVAPQDMLDVLLRAQPAVQGVPKDILDECKTLLVAGFETTALTLTWALQLLATHPHIAQRWHAECDQVLGQKAHPDADDLKKLEFTRSVIFETMRLYPVVYTQPRVCVESDILAGRRVKRGDVLLLSVYGIHRNPDYWQHPDRFDPDRFYKNRNWPRRAYMPFGKGSHMCLGNNFSVQEMLIVLAMIGRSWTLTACEHEIQPLPRVVLVPQSSVPLELKARG